MGCSSSRGQSVYIPSGTKFSTIPAGAPGVKVQGRVVRGPHGLRFDWSGTRIVFKVPLSVLDGMVVVRMDGADNYFNIYVNSDRYYLGDDPYLYAKSGLR